MADPIADIFQKVDTFTRQMYYTMAEKDSNLFISPFSLHALLVMVYEGSTCYTRQEFENCLNLHRPQIDIDAYKQIILLLNNIEEFELCLPRKVYVEAGYRINEVYSRFAEGFSAEIERVNFMNNVNATQKINSWFGRVSNNQLLNITNPGDFHDLTRMVLASAAYFKGEWLYKFDLTKTKIEEFRIPESTTIECMMMFVSGNIPYARNKELSSDILRLRFTNNSFSLMILLPRTIRGMSHLERQLQHVSFTELIETLNTTRKLNVYLPKFLMERKYDFTHKLRTLGFWRAFCGTAEFRNIIEGDPAYISKIIQKTTVAVNEHGMETVLMEDHNEFSEEVEFDNKAETILINHHFMFALIFEHEGKYCPISIGKVYAP